MNRVRLNQARNTTTAHPTCGTVNDRTAGSTSAESLTRIDRTHAVSPLVSDSMSYPSYPPTSTDRTDSMDISLQIQLTPADRLSIALTEITMLAKERENDTMRHAEIMATYRMLLHKWAAANDAGK